MVGSVQVSDRAQDLDQEDPEVLAVRLEDLEEADQDLAAVVVVADLQDLGVEQVDSTLGSGQGLAKAAAVVEAVVYRLEVLADKLGVLADKPEVSGDRVQALPDRAPDSDKELALTPQELEVKGSCQVHLEDHSLS